MQHALARSFMMLIFSTSLMAQTTWLVDAAGTPPGTGTPTDPYTSIQYAVAQTTTISGDTILVLPGTYAERVDYSGKNVTIQSSAGAETTIIDGNDLGSVVTFKNGEGPGAVLDGFTVQDGLGTQNGSFYDGGGINAQNASPTLRNLIVRDNVARRGGGIYLENSNALVSDCTIQANGTLCYACYPQYGGGVWASGSPTFEDCAILQNGNMSEGGGVYGAGSYVGCTIAGNSALFGGGARGLGATFQDCFIYFNAGVSVDSDPGWGAGVYGGTLIDCVVDSNGGAYQGGGAYQATLIDCVILHNRVSKPLNGYPNFIVQGAGAASCQLTNCDVFGNVAGNAPIGGALRPGNGGGVAGGTATGCRIYDNTTFSRGPITGSQISNTGLGGGGAYGATLFDCDVYANEVRTGTETFTTPGGGGLFAGSATRCRIWGNAAPYGGGAADAQIVLCTLSGNTATAAGGGVAAVVSPTNAVAVESSILWGNSVPETALAGGSIVIAYSDVQGGFPGTGNFDLDPQFAGVASFDFHLLASSPCIDAGNPSLPLDPDATIADVGAFPFTCGTHGYCVAKVNSLGCTPEIGWSGTPSLSGPDDFTVTASEVLNQKFGLLLWSRASAATPFFGGTLCLAPTIHRTPAQNSGGNPTGSDCTGTYAFHFSQGYMAAQGIAALETIFAQYYTRDPLHTDGTGVGTTDAVAFAVCP